MDYMPARAEKHPAAQASATNAIVGRAILPADQLSSWSSRLKRRLHNPVE
jgi:hypothetical protein